MSHGHSTKAAAPDRRRAAALPLLIISRILNSTKHAPRCEVFDLPAGTARRSGGGDSACRSAAVGRADRLAAPGLYVGRLFGRRRKREGGQSVRIFRNA